MIERVAASHPNTWWWVKGDRVDIVKGLWESARELWTGDVDPNDGKLQLRYQEFQDRLQRNRSRAKKQQRED